MEGSLVRVYPNQTSSQCVNRIRGSRGYAVVALDELFLGNGLLGAKGS
jgi:hypothetical protein